ncbi:MAG: EAL domain-containing protein [Burkholderiales bacterium]|jgi:EAL domain-containing protein (putative c-di-GMP-specific phosphodiesterase class I)|nr:EAL domain-containing protein [Burkholderiales bacterium]
MSAIEQALQRLDPAWLADARFALGPDATAVFAADTREVGSVFQPVTVARDGQVLGHQGRVRVRTAAGVVQAAGWVGLADGVTDAHALSIDRWSRTLHAVNYASAFAAGQRLFLRVQPRLIESVGRGHGRVFEGILARLGIPTRAVVIELPAWPGADPALIERALWSYRSLGYKVACDWPDAAVAPPLSRAGGVVPDVVRIDLRAPCATDAIAERAARAHDAGAQVHVAGIETAADREVARAVDAELLSGWAVGRPQPAGAIAMPAGTRTVGDRLVVEALHA